MTCASCANRIERKLNKLDGVVATVNYATEKAKVTYPADVTPKTLLETVEQAGIQRRVCLEPREARTARSPTMTRRDRSGSGCWSRSS